MQNRQLRGQLNRNNILRDNNFAELLKLEHNVNFNTQRNRQKYNKILYQQPNYTVELYEPNDKLKTQKAFKKQLLLKQLDKLMDQENIFDKKLAQIKFLKQMELQEQQKFLDKELNPYQALRTVWARHEKTSIQANNSFDRLESLNFTIGMIKNTVIGMKLNEQQYAQNYQMEPQITTNKKYQKLLQNYEKSMMMNQQLRQQINSLQIKLVNKQINQNKLNQKMLEKQKQLKTFKKEKQLLEIDQKFTVAHLKQQIFIIQKKIQKIQKWKSNLQKIYFENKTDNFKIFFQINQTNAIKNQELSLRLNSTSKSLIEIQNFLKQNIDQILIQNNQDSLNCSKLDQQNSQILIPSLNLIEKTEEICMRKKMPTDRPLKAKNVQVQKFLGGRIIDLRYSKLPTNFNDQSIKKFVRKNPVLGTSRRFQPQFSERRFEPVVNETN